MSPSGDNYKDLPPAVKEALSKAFMVDLAETLEDIARNPDALTYDIKTRQFGPAAA